jgi:hypothetical protein
VRHRPGLTGKVERIRLTGGLINERRNAVQSEEEKANPPLKKRETVAVNPSRLAWGVVSRKICEGDIHASYSADVIAMTGRVRKPFKWNGALCVCTGISGSGLTQSGMQEHEAYRIVPVEIFTGTKTTYREKTARAETAEAARNDPSGFYHGMTIKHGAQSFVLCGPPIRFTADASPRGPMERLAMTHCS